MKKILAIADPIDANRGTVARAARLATSIGAHLEVVGFVYEHLASLPEVADASGEDIRNRLLKKHRQAIQAQLKQTGIGRKGSVAVYWEKRVAEKVVELTAHDEFELVVKGGHRSETLAYTPTDWQLLRTCRPPVLLLCHKQWKRSRHVMAAVDLGTKVKSKQQLNVSVVQRAASIAAALGAELHIAYAVPFSKVLRDLGVLDRAAIKREGSKRAKAFAAELEALGIEVAGVHVATGAPEKVLINLAAKNSIGLVVLGCVGRKKVVGRVLGNTAEQILRLLKADVLAIKP